jgi:hypothetical protein
MEPERLRGLLPNPTTVDAALVPEVDVRPVPVDPVPVDPVPVVPPEPVLLPPVPVDPLEPVVLLDEFIDCRTFCKFKFEICAL